MSMFGDDYGQNMSQSSQTQGGGDREGAGTSNRQKRGTYAPKLTGSEIAVMLDFLQENYDRLYGKVRDPQYYEVKKAAWEEVAALVKAVHGVERTGAQIKNKIDNLFTKAKKKQNDWKVYRKALNKTGNAPAPPEPQALTDAERAVYTLLSESPSFKGVANSDDETDVVLTAPIVGVNENDFVLATNPQNTIVAVANSETVLSTNDVINLVNVPIEASVPNKSANLPESRKRPISSAAGSPDDPDKPSNSEGRGGRRRRRSLDDARIKMAENAGDKAKSESQFFEGAKKLLPVAQEVLELLREQLTASNNDQRVLNNILNTDI